MSGHPDDPQTLPPRESLEARVQALLEQCTTALGRAALEGERADRALARFEAHLRDGDGVASRVERETAQRLQELERLVRQEWSALRDLHEEPLRELRQQAQQLTEVSLAAAHVAQQGFDAAETRLAAIEARLDQRLADLSREVREALEALEAQPRGALPSTAEPEAWSRPGPAPVTTGRVLPLRVLPELDDASEPPASGPELIDPPTVDTAPVAAPPAGIPEVAAPAPQDIADARARDSRVVELSARLQELERTLEERQDDTWRAADRERRATRTARVAFGLVVLMVVAAIGVTLGMRASVRRQVEAAAVAASGTAERADAETSAARAASARDAAAARELSARTQRMGGILVAPDLVRRALYGTTRGSMAVAQVFWSRTRGLVLSASRVPAAPAGSTYQVWVLWSGDPVSAGRIIPDADGTALLVADAPALTSPFLGVVVTEEPDGGSAKPTGRLVLARYPTQPE